MNNKKCPECKSNMSQSEWTGYWHCENFSCRVYLDSAGEVKHKSISLADVGKKGTGKKKAYGVGT